MAKVQLIAEAREDIRGLDGASRQRVLRALKKLESEPEKRGAPLGSKATGNLTGLRKLVVGDRDLRVIYRVEKDVVVVVWVIGARADSECYQLAMSRLKSYASDVTLGAELASLIEETWAHLQG